jgi:predicted ATPase
VEAGLSDDDLADRTGLSRRYICDLERGKGPSPHQTSVRRIAEALNLNQSERAILLASAHGPKAVPSLRHLRSNLPRQLSSFIGRERELAELRALLARDALLTMTGPGGVGKSRLALKAVADAIDGFDDGAWVVELAPLVDQRFVPQVVAAALGIEERPNEPVVETLTRHLQSRCLLLLLDNCEHLIHASAQMVDQLLRGCPGLHIVCTSRESLGITGEVIWPVSPLGFPPPGPFSTPQELAKTEAVRLFVERARAAAPHFKLNGRNAAAVAEICRKLEGLPLAIELAAARVKLLSTEQIAARLDDPFDLLTGGSRTAPARHQTLRRAIDWSYELLSDAEQVLLQRLSVFAGGWTLEATEAVCAGGRIRREDVLELLGHLVDKSFVVPQEEHGEVARYRLLETLRQYLSRRLAQCGELEAVRDQHRNYYLAFAEQVAPHLVGGPECGIALQTVGSEQDNLRSALQWCIDRGEVDRGLRLGGAVWRFWFVRGSGSEGQAWLEALLRIVNGASETASRALALNGAGALATQRGDYDLALELFEESLRIWQELDDQDRIGNSLSNLGMLALRRGDYGAARSMLERSLAINRKAGNRVGTAMTLNNLGYLFQEQADYGAASAAYAESAAAYRGLGDKLNLAAALRDQGFAVFGRGDVVAAAALCEESLALIRDLSDATETAWFCFDLALMRIQQRDWAAAQALFTESLTAPDRHTHATVDDTRIPLCLAGLARVAAVQGNHERAVRLTSAADALRMTWIPSRMWSGKALWSGPPFDSASVERWLLPSRAALGESASAEADSAGRAMSLEEARVYATLPANILDQCRG